MEQLELFEVMTADRQNGLITNVLEDVFIERKRQLKKWGIQHHPLGGHWSHQEEADEQKRWNDHLVETDSLTWKDILLEEVWEALTETDPIKMREELVQVAAVAAAMIEDIDVHHSRA